MKARFFTATRETPCTVVVFNFLPTNKFKLEVTKSMLQFQDILVWTTFLTFFSTVTKIKKNNHRASPNQGRQQLELPFASRVFVVRRVHPVP